MFPTAANQLLVVLMLVGIWYLWLRSVGAASKRVAEARRQVAAERLDSSREEEPPPKAVLIESEPALEPVPIETSTAAEEPVVPPRIPTGTACVVRKARRFLRCTEFEVEGELKTEIRRVNRHGKEIGKAALRDGSCRAVADGLLNLKAA